MGMAALDAQLKSINIMRASLEDMSEIIETEKPTEQGGALEVKRDE
jgi:hypothetical protein